MEAFVADPTRLIIAALSGLVILLFLIIKGKLQPLIAILISALCIGLIGGMPVSMIVDTVNKGMGETLKGIALLVGLGSMFGAILEISGGAERVALTMIRRFGEARAPWALGLTGMVVAIPVFFDAGLIILIPLAFSIARRARKSTLFFVIPLLAGLAVGHAFIPPTPGPLAAPNPLGVGNNLLLVMGVGALASVFPLIAGYFYAKFIGGKVKSADEEDASRVTKSYEQLVAEYGKLPGGLNALAPILVPIVLMALGSIASMAGWTGMLFSLCDFLGKPIIALAVGTIFGILQLAGAGKMADFYTITNETLKTTGPILFVTAAGGVLGKVISSTSLVSFITDNATALEAVGILFPFLLAAILKSAQGSSTVAITTTAGIVAPLLGVLGLASPVRAALTVMAIGAGAMTVSHANDSYFWVVTNFGEMTPEQGYKTQTMMTLVLGVASMVEIFLLSLVF